MLRTGAQYLDGIRDGRAVYLGGERPRTRPRRHPRLCRTQREPQHPQPPADHQSDWHAKWRAVDAVLNDLGGVVTRKLLAFARDLLNSDYAGHRPAFVQFAQAPHFNHRAAVYKAFDFDGPLDFVRRAAGLSDSIES